MKRKILPLALILTVGFAGCYGPFNLTRKLHKWNGTMGSKWANEAAFLGLAILPVYFFATLADAVVLNSIEFWSGKNPVTAKNVKSIQAGDEQAVLSYAPDSKRLRVDSFRNGRPEATVIFEPTSGGMVARGSSGEVLMKASTLAGGRVVLTRPDGSQLGTYDPVRLARMLPQTN
jgi:hypothetical protein